MRVEREIEQRVNYTGSWGETKPKTRTMKYIVRLPEGENTYGSFELYDVESGGEEFYGEGGLWFSEKGELQDYDGVFSLSDTILDMCEENGFNVEDMRKTLS